MTSIKTKKEIAVPCKNKITGKEKTFYVLAFDFADAQNQLEYILHPVEWIIGWECF